MRTASLLIICLVLAACGMKGDLYEPTPPPAQATAPETNVEAGPQASPEPAEATDPRDGRKTLPTTPDPGRSR